MSINIDEAMRHYGVRKESLLRDKMYGTRSALSENELNEILGIVDTYEAPVYGEIGVYFGGTFRAVLEKIKDKDSFGCGFDLFEDLEGETFGKDQTHELYNKFYILNVAFRDGLTDKLQSFGLDKFELVKGSSDITVPNSNKVFDVFLIDGNHTYAQTKKDFECVIKKCKSGSTIIFDNSSNDIEPDPRYVEIDGGPWKVCEELRNDNRVDFIKKLERLTIFKVV